MHAAGSKGGNVEAGEQTEEVDGVLKFVRWWLAQTGFKNNQRVM